MRQRLNDKSKRAKEDPEERAKECSPAARAAKRPPNVYAAKRPPDVHAAKRPPNVRAKIRKPNAFLYCVLYLLIYPVLKVLFRLKVDRSQYNPPKGAFIVVSNHQSFMDFLLVMLTVYPYRLNAVAAQKFFFYRPLNKLLPLMGSIPKNLFDPDLRSVMAIMEVIKRGDRLLLFPEGRCSTHGPYMGMHKATGKLIKKLNVPVISCHIEGAYTCMPFWRKGFRCGRIRVTLANLFSAADTQVMTVDEINSRIDARLSGVDGGLESIGAKPLGLFRARRLAEGLENILYYCPVCHQEFTLKTVGNSIYCTACGSAVTMNRNAELVSELVSELISELISDEASALPKTVSQWYETQAAYEMQALRDGMKPLGSEVIVRMPLDAGRGLEVCGQGMLTLDSEGWRYDGELSGENVRMFFPLATVAAIPFDPNDNFQIYANGSFYVFTPKANPCAAAKYATVGECAYWRFISAIQMTPGYIRDILPTACLM